MSDALRGREVTIPARGGAPETPAFACVPEGAERGVVVIHELFGRQPEIDRVVLRLAEAGFAVVAPDLFARGRLACLREVFTRTMRTGEGIAAEQGRNARAWLREHAGVSADRVGLVGFCFGGGYALATGRGWGAVNANYGAVPPEEVLSGIGPVLACYGGRDRSMRALPERLRRRLERVGAEHEVLVFEGAGHSFLTDGDHPLARAVTAPLLALGDYPTEREEGWEKILAFLARL